MILLNEKTERDLRDLIYHSLPKANRGRTSLGRRCVIYQGDYDTHVICKLHKLHHQQLISLYKRLHKMGLIDAEIS